MASAETHGYGTPVSGFHGTQDRTVEFATGGSLTEAVGGLAVIALGITALVGWYRVDLVAIAAIVAGAGMLLEGTSTALRYARVMMAAPAAHTSGMDLGGGLTTEFAGGAAGIILGILALLHIFPAILLPISVIVFGAAILFGAVAMGSLNTMMVEQQFNGVGLDGTRRLAGAAVSAASGTQVLVGIAAVVLGIIGVANGNGLLGLILSAVAFLCLGSAMMVNGCALGARMVGMLHHERRTI
jgi:hypothetical protein